MARFMVLQGKNIEIHRISNDHCRTPDSALGVSHADRSTWCTLWHHPMPTGLSKEEHGCGWAENLRRMRSLAYHMLAVSGAVSTRRSGRTKHCSGMLKKPTKSDAFFMRQ